MIHSLDGKDPIAIVIKSRKEVRVCFAEKPLW